MALLPDVLDHLGRTPREFGALHVHFESLLVCGDRALATVLFQAAFDPVPKGGEAVLFASNVEHFEIRELGRFTVPAFDRGLVVRVRCPFSTVGAFNLTHVQLRLDVPAPKRFSERIREPWKLFDTVEAPKLSELSKDPYLSSMRRWNNDRPGLTELAEEMFRAVPKRSEKARILPPGLLVPVQEQWFDEVSAPHIEVIWRVGDPLPPAPPVTRTAAPVPPLTGNKRCMACGFTGPLTDYERRRTCPNCDHYWT